MRVDRAWVERNLGFNPIDTPAPVDSFATLKAAKPKSEPEDLQREIIEFDSAGPAGTSFLAFTTTTGLSRFSEIPWPKGLEPITDKTVRKGSAGRLPKADVLVVTWTADEGHALSRVLIPGKDSHNDYVPYTRNFAAQGRSYETIARQLLRKDYRSSSCFTPTPLRVAASITQNLGLGDTRTYMVFSELHTRAAAFRQYV